MPTEPSPDTAGWRLDNTYARLPGDFHERIAPTPVSSPEVVILDRALAADLGLDPESLSGGEGEAWLSGNRLPPGADPIAQAYAGHQYGHFTMLGDGRAILLGEQLTPDGRRFDIQLKGSGRTRFSRGGDGRAALGPMLREFLVSRFMHAMGIPTTRSLAVVATGDPVYREQRLPGAILTRVAASHIRVGTFEWAAATRDPVILRTLADYTLRRHFPELTDSTAPWLAMYAEILTRQAALVARWQCVGFVHGVMNTDNMALSGETIDYGPCAFMEACDPDTVFSSIDQFGRYAWGQQPFIAQWNLTRLAEAMLPLLGDSDEVALEAANEAVARFPEAFRSAWLSGMRAKLGLFNIEDGDASLIESLLDWMHRQKSDFTESFRALTIHGAATELPGEDASFHAWRETWRARLSRQPQSPDEVRMLMQLHNPAFIPRNHKVEEALAAATSCGDIGPARQLADILSNPCDYSTELPEFQTPGSEGIPYRTFCGT